ncbi:hypothetical protein B5S28_g124 [[Candida] boidinii]|nr:hypothetical protein B5S28_g124 [[Candida] boidinii]OWB76345.1 hypothetical protein B5S32_g496 [[Candida] boidinii]
MSLMPPEKSEKQTDNGESKTAVSYHKVPSAQIKASLRSSLWIIFSMVSIASVVGIPLWYLTTTVPKAEIPHTEIANVNELINHTNEIKFNIPIYLDVPSPLKGMIKETQDLIDQELHSLGINEYWNLELLFGEGKPNDYKLNLEMVESEKYDDNTVESNESIFISPFDRSVKLFISDKIISHNKVPDFISKVLINIVFIEEIKLFKEFKNIAGASEDANSVSVQYSPKFHIVLNLLNGGLDPVSWDIEEISPIFIRYLNELKQFANFTLDAQLESYNSISDDINIHWDNDSSHHILDMKDTSKFIDYSEWGLDRQTDLVPTINFVAYIPDSKYFPLKIENSPTNSFIVPQWGGLQILNIDTSFSDSIHLDKDVLLPVLETFTSQLFHLLGAPKNPKSLPIRIDIMTRLQILKNLKTAANNLLSLSKLVKQLDNISIPNFTLIKIGDAMKEINLSIESLHKNDWSAANHHSAKAAIFADESFFQKDMVQQLYFPDEHKMAIYVPLLGPLISLTAVGLFKTIVEFFKD